MVERIDELIKSLQELKKEKISSDQKSTKIFEIFKDEQEDFTISSESIYRKIDDLKKEVLLIDSNRDEFFKNLENIFSNNNNGSSSGLGSNTTYLENKNNNNNNNIKMEEFKEVGLKRFYKQESFLSELMKTNNYQTIYNIFISFFLISIAIFTLEGVIENKFIVNFSKFFGHFDGSMELIKMLFLKQCFAIATIIVINFLICHIGRNQLIKLNLVLIALLKVMFFYIFSHLSPGKNFSIFMRFIHYSDNLCCLFKVLSYYFEKVLLLSYYNNMNLNENRKAISLPDIALHENINHSFVILDNGRDITFNFKSISQKHEIINFIYFFNSPTLIYRDAYPRNNKRNYLKIFLHIINMLFSILFFFLIVDLKFSPFIHDHEYNFLRKDFIRTLVTFCFYSMMLLFVVFFGLFHSYFNFSAEILLFADRNFYSDFFNSLNPQDFMLKFSYYHIDFFEYYLSHLLQPYLISRSVIKIISYSAVIEVILSKSFNTFCPIIATSMVFCALSACLFKQIKIHQKQYLNWLFVTFFTGLSFLVIFVEFMYISNETQDRNSNYDKNMKNTLSTLILPKFLYLLNI